MADDDGTLIEPQADVAELLPLDEDLATAEQELSLATTSLEDETDFDVEVEEPPAPIGRSWAFDFTRNEMVMAGRSPLTTVREATLRIWVQKCLNTAEGAHPVCPAGYGLRKPLNDYLGASPDISSIGELEDDVRDALLFHPAITDITDFSVWVNEDDTAQVEMSFAIVLDDAEALDLGLTLDRTGEVVGFTNA